MTNIKEQTIPTAYSREVNVESTLKYMGEVITFLAKGTETNGRFAFMEVKVRPGTEPRRLTQLASLKVNEAGLDGIYYRSRYGHDLENWALFEPFEISSPEAPIAVRPDDVDLQEACRLLGLTIDRT